MSRSGWWIEEYERGRARGLGEAEAVRAASLGEAVGRTDAPKRHCHENLHGALCIFNCGDGPCSLTRENEDASE